MWGSRLLVSVSIFMILLVGAPAAVMAADEFPIILINKLKGDLPNSMEALACGGFANGVEGGTRGEIWDVSGETEQKLADVEVQDVTAYESASLVTNITGRKPTIYDKVKFEVENLSAEQHRAQGLAAFEAGAFDKALYHLKLCTPPGSSANDSLVVSSIAECNRQIEAEKNTPISRKERLALNGKVDSYLTMAGYHFMLGNLEATELYLDKVLRIDDKQMTACNLKKIVATALEPLPDVCYGMPDDTGKTMLEEGPQMTKATAPKYPRAAQMAGLTGTVWVKALVSSCGSVRKAVVYKSSGYSWLDASAVLAAYDNEYKPATVEGEPVTCWVSYKVEFTL